MKRKFFGMLLMGAMTIASVGMFTSCKDYDDDINNLQKQIDGITAQNLQSQLTTLQGALQTAQGAATAAQSTADQAVKAAADAQKAAEAAAAAASGAQGTADAAAAAAEAAQKAADAARAIADAAAKQETVAALETAIGELKDIINGKIGQAELDAAIRGVEAKIAAINENLLTLADVKELLANAGFAAQAAVADLEGQIRTLNAFMESVKNLDPIVDQAWKDKVDAAIASLEGIKTDIAAKADASALDAKADKSALDEKANKADLDALEGRMKAAEDAIQALNDLKIGEKLEKLAYIGAKVDVLNIFVARDLKSLVLRPDTYYGGIEGISIYQFVFKVERPVEEADAAKQKDFHYFDSIATNVYPLAKEANYHVNPSNVDLTNYNIDFYNWIADIKSPVASEQPFSVTRSGKTGISPVYKTTDELHKANPDYLKDGILTIPYECNTDEIYQRLQESKGTIASLSLTKQGKDGAADTTVNSDYAIVVPEYGFNLLIGDNTFPVGTRHLDQIGYDGGPVNSSNLHRSFSFLALAATSPTHTIMYKDSFDITKVLESRYVPFKKDYYDEITDTANLHNSHKAIAKWNLTTTNKDEDGDASIDKNKVVTMKPELFESLGLKYDIKLVDYTLGSNKTGESVHLELITNKDGHVIAYPRNVTDKGETINGKTANTACVGRQPIVCIMVRDKEDNIVSFAYMKFLITPDNVAPEDDKQVEFDVENELWVDCSASYAGRVTWSQVENRLLMKLGPIDEKTKEPVGMSKKVFDENYVFDFYKEETKDPDGDATYSKVTRYGIQYSAKNGVRVDTTKTFGSVDEEWNVSAQGAEDATTHIIKWSFTNTELVKKAKELQASDELEDKGNYWANKNEIVTWVRYAHLTYTPIKDAPDVGKTPEKGKPSIWVKLTIPAGAIRVAKGDMGANKILTFWYDLNSKTNATGINDAYEVRVNVPVPVPESSATVKTIGYDYPANTTKLDIRYDNLLEKAEDPKANRANKAYTEFTKNLKDFFIDGQLNAFVKDPGKGQFDSIGGMKLGCEFTYPSTTLKNASFDKGTNHTVPNSWTVKGYTGAEYTLILNDDHTKIQIKAKDDTVYPIPVDLVTLNYDDNDVDTLRQITVLNYVNGEDQDDILNYKTHNELDERETFTAYINIVAVDACAPVFWDNMWFNVRFLRPLDLENPKQGLVPDAPNDWHTVDLTDALIVKDWREYYGDRQNRTGGKDVSIVLPSVGNQKAFDYAYYQVELDITENVYYTDANLGTNQRSDVYTLGHMPVIADVDDAKAKGFILTSQVPNLKLEKTGKTKLRYLNNSGVTGGFHVFIPITMTYVYGFQSVRQTKWVTVGVTPSVEQAMFE